VYKQEDLTKQLQQKDPPPPNRDLHGHGTACAGIAAGNGRAFGKERFGKYAGVAPEADLIVVRLSKEGDLENGFLLGSGYEWLDKLAREHNKPLVVSCSFGGQFGGRDGSRVWEHQLNARLRSRPQGRAICIAAGNEGAKPLHAAVSFAGKDNKGKLLWNTPKRALVTICFDSDNLEDLRVEPIGMTTIEGKAYRNGITGLVVFELRVNGRQGVYLYNDSNKKMAADAYISHSEYGAAFDKCCVQAGKQVTSPGTATEVITVGSYDFNDRFNEPPETYGFTNSEGEEVPLQIGALSNFSNHGPCRGANGSRKPDLAAPGRFFTACAPAGVADLTRDTSGKYRLFAGTSAATPYTAGVIALMFHKKKTLTASRIKTLLQSKVTKDRFTKQVDGSTPDGWNPAYGYGKLTLEAVTDLLQSLDKITD
jgi:subtilisin family serine protease